MATPPSPPLHPLTCLTLAQTVSAAMLGQARDGAQDGDLVRRFKRARRDAKAKGLRGPAADGAALAMLLSDQALEVRALLLGLGAQGLIPSSAPAPELPAAPVVAEPGS